MSPWASISFLSPQHHTKGMWRVQEAASCLEQATTEHEEKYHLWTFFVLVPGMGTEDGQALKNGRGFWFRHWLVPQMLMILWLQLSHGSWGVMKDKRVWVWVNTGRVHHNLLLVLLPLWGNWGTGLSHMPKVTQLVSGGAGLELTLCFQPLVSCYLEAIRLW